MPEKVLAEDLKPSAGVWHRRARLWLAPPLAPSAVRSLAWKATSDPWSNTDWHMIKGPSTAAWTNTDFPVAAPSNSAEVVTRRTPLDAVPIGSLTKAGNRSQPFDPDGRGRLGNPRDGAAWPTPRSCPARRPAQRKRERLWRPRLASAGPVGPRQHRHLLLSGE